MTRSIVSVVGSMFTISFLITSSLSNVFGYHLPLTRDAILNCEQLEQEIIDRTTELLQGSDSLESAPGEIDRRLAEYHHLCGRDVEFPPPSDFPPIDRQPPPLPPSNCGINPYAPPCNIPCFDPNNPYCQDDLYPVMGLEGENINMTVTIADNRIGDFKEIRGSPNEVRTVLFNETVLSQLSDVERTQALNQASLIIDDIVSSQALWTSVDTSFEINYGPPAELPSPTPIEGNATATTAADTDVITIHIEANKQQQ